MNELPDDIKRALAELPRELQPDPASVRQHAPLGQSSGPSQPNFFCCAETSGGRHTPVTPLSPVSQNCPTQLAQCTVPHATPGISIRSAGVVAASLGTSGGIGSPERPQPAVTRARTSSARRIHPL